MILDFTLDPSYRRRTQESDLGSADETDLRYSFLQGDIHLKAGECDLSAKWGWVPIVDFATCLRITCKELQQDGAESVLDFTENDETVVFKRNDRTVSITASYGECEIRVSLDEFLAAVDTFIHKVATDLPAEFPALSRNEAFHRLMSGDIFEE